MWISARDICALAATVAARASMQKKLATHLSIGLDSPEALFAMSIFHKFYQRTFERCVNVQGSSADEHQLVMVPKLVYHMLRALGFCTFVDALGEERPLLDEKGRPICHFLSNIKTALAARSDVRSISNIPTSLQPLLEKLEEFRPKKKTTFTFGKRGTDFYHQKKAWTTIFDAFLHSMVRAEPYATGDWSRSPYDKAVLRQLHGAANAMNVCRNAADVAIQDLRMSPADNSGRDSSEDSTAAQWIRQFERFLQTDWLPITTRFHRRISQQIVSMESKSPEGIQLTERHSSRPPLAEAQTNDSQQGAQPGPNFPPGVHPQGAKLSENLEFVESAMVQTDAPSMASNPSVSDINRYNAWAAFNRRPPWGHARAVESPPTRPSQQSVAEPKSTRSPRETFAEAQATASPVANTPVGPQQPELGYPRADAYATQPGMPGHTETGLSEFLAQGTVNSQVSKLEEQIRLARRSKESKSGVAAAAARVSATIAAAAAAEPRKQPKQNKPPSRLSLYEIARQVEERPPNTRRQRRLAVQDQERPQRRPSSSAAPECDGLKQDSCRRSQVCTWRRGVCSPRSQAVPVSQSVVQKAGSKQPECLSLSEEACSRHFDCTWNQDEKTCAQTPILTQDISGYRSQQMGRPDTAEYFNLASRDAARFTKRGFSGCESLKRNSCKKRKDACSWNTDKETCSARSPAASSPQAASDATPEQIAPVSPAAPMVPVERPAEDKTDVAARKIQTAVRRRQIYQWVQRYKAKNREADRRRREEKAQRDLEDARVMKEWDEGVRRGKQVLAARKIQEVYRRQQARSIRQHEKIQDEAARQIRTVEAPSESAYTRARKHGVGWAKNLATALIGGAGAGFLEPAKAPQLHEKTLPSHAQSMLRAEAAYAMAHAAKLLEDKADAIRALEKLSRVRPVNKTHSDELSSWRQQKRKLQQEIDGLQERIQNERGTFRDLLQNIPAKQAFLNATELPVQRVLQGNRRKIPTRKREPPDSSNLVEPSGSAYPWTMGLLGLGAASMIRRR